MLIRLYAAGDDISVVSGQEVELRPSKVIGIGKNYRAHAAEMGGDPPKQPLLFLKANSALIGAGDAIRRPGEYSRVDYEGELGVVIGTRAKRVSAADALDVVMGFTCINDVTVRDLQKSDGQWARAKSFDTFCPIGPHLVSGLDPSNLAIMTRVNGEVRQQSTTADLIFSVPELIEFVSRYMTLDVGDVISTGTPSGVGNLEVGDVVQVEIEGIGVLENRVVADDDS
jgi:2-keto-4-pentenoate hydratase/2-oxohepta-3-ene-1,7-dioic acid hydratase in catechol pathway